MPFHQNPNRFESDDPYRSGNRFREDDPLDVAAPLEDDEEQLPREWVPSRPYRKLPFAHEGTGGSGLTQKHTSLFLEGHPIAIVSRMGMTQARWDPDTEELQIWFGSKALGYTPFTWNEAQDFITATSKGTYWWDHIGIRGKGNKGKLRKASREL